MQCDLAAAFGHIPLVYLLRPLHPGILKDFLTLRSHSVVGQQFESTCDWTCHGDLSEFLEAMYVSHSGHIFVAIQERHYLNCSDV